MTDETRVLAETWRGMNEVAFVSARSPHGNLGPPSEPTEVVYASNFLATLHAAGYSLVPTATLERARRIETAARMVVLWPYPHEPSELANLRAALSDRGES